MKALSIILSIYLLILSCLPCGDVEDCKIEGNEKIAFSETSHTNHQEDSESCTPFCICACCGTTISSFFNLLNNTVEKQALTTTQKTKIIFSNDPLVSNFFGKIWQPPQI